MYLFLLGVYMYILHVYACTCVSGDDRSQKRASDPLEMELVIGSCMVCCLICELGTELGSFGRILYGTKTQINSQMAP